MSFTHERTALGQQIKERVVEKHTRGTLLPDTATAFKAIGFSHQVIGTTNSMVSVGFWAWVTQTYQTIAKGIAQELITVSSGGNPEIFQGLRENDLLVDLSLRTPQGVKNFPNVPLHLDAMGDHANEIRDQIERGGTLQVKVTYDGGRPSECTPVAWRIDKPSGNQIAAQSAGAAVGGGPMGTLSGGTWSYGTQQISGVPSGEVPPAIAGAIDTAAKRHGLDPRYLAAICWQETQYGALLDSQHRGDYGHGYGLFQLDDRSHSAAQLAAVQNDPQAAAEVAASMLAASIGKGYTLHQAANIYNSGHPGDRGTTYNNGLPYGQNVMNKYGQLCSQYPVIASDVFANPADGRVPGVATTTGSQITGSKSASKYRFLCPRAYVLWHFIRDINAAGALFKIDPNMVATAIMLRSGGNTKLVDGGGRMGLFAYTFEDFKNRFAQMAAGNAELASFPKDPLNPTAAIFVGASDLAGLIASHALYKDAIIAFGTGEDVSGIKLLTGTTSSNGTAYYRRFRALWGRLQNQSAELTGDQLARRPEVKRQEHSGAADWTGGAAVFAGF